MYKPSLLVAAEIGFTKLFEYVNSKVYLLMADRVY